MHSPSAAHGAAERGDITLYMCNTVYPPQRTAPTALTGMPRPPTLAWPLYFILYTDWYAEAADPGVAPWLLPPQGIPATPLQS